MSTSSTTSVNCGVYLQANVVYKSSDPHDLYPDGEYIRTYSPEYSGIPAMPAVCTSRRNVEQGYSSEDSSYTAGGYYDFN